MKIYQVQISLKGITPKIWRRLLVPADMPLQDFHRVIQTSMGWFNMHLHQFIKDRMYYVEPNEEDDFRKGSGMFDYSEMKVSDLLKQEDDQIGYEYDFGDGWRHDIVLEKILEMKPGISYPECVAGKRNCPPEDCGGPLGYSDFVKILSNPKHKDHKELMEMTGGNYDPEFFDMEDINERLKEEDYGTPSFL